MVACARILLVMVCLHNPGLMHDNQHRVNQCALFLESCHFFALQRTMASGLRNWVREKSWVTWPHELWAGLWSFHPGTFLKFICWVVRLPMWSVFGRPRVANTRGTHLNVRGVAIREHLACANNVNKPMSRK